MERLTYRDASGEAWYSDAGTEADRLHFIASIEDILGDYDLDRLRELVEADLAGRCVVLPCKGWLETVFGDQEVFYGIDRNYTENQIREISVDSSDRCTWYDGWKTVVIKGYDENGFDWEFSPEEIGKTVFTTIEAAEAALNEEKHPVNSWFMERFMKVN